MNLRVSPAGGSSVDSSVLERTDGDLTIDDEAVSAASDTGHADMIGEPGAQLRDVDGDGVGRWRNLVASP